ncbi:PAAR-like protein [uncultured Aquimarina sp.]|uniref:PAAR-like protein n=1 Tax=uncultured Aquimarina sp. TaxID=575652 RepID=UPI002614BDC2|nr:PAAR-like protein [uncultured Aquimarina sp.]
MATETKEVRISYTSVQILCTKSVGGAPSVMSTPIKSVGISKGLASTEQDIIPSTHIVPFAGCNYMGQCLACVPTGKWKLPAESTLNVVKRVPLVEDSEFDCTARSGKITFNFNPVKTVPPANKKPNIVDNAKAKINSAANSVVKKTTEALKDVTEGITGAFDGLKPVLENTQAANLATSLDTQVQKLNELKKQTDSRVKDLDKEITELKKKIEAKLTGKAYTPPTNTKKETEIQVTTSKDEIDLQNAEEEKRNESLYDEGTNEAIKEYENFINSKITPTTTVREIEVEKEITSTNKDDVVENTTSLPNTTSDKENNTTKTYLDQLSDTSKDLGLDKNQDTQEALKLLDNMDTILINDPKGSTADQTKVIIQNERNTLNSKVQASIEEELKELGYYEKLKKYNEESNDLQKDIDKTSLTLKSIGDFGGFIDGLKNKYLGKIGAKYGESLNKLSNNLSTLNTSMDGLSYVADGFPKGEVFTNVIREIKDEDNENGDGTNNNGSGNIFGSLDDVLNDRNTEPKILRIYAIYAQDPDEGEEYKNGDIITVDFIPPNIKVDLIIQANGKADGAIVDLDLQERSFHYDPIENSGRSTVRNGLFENITLQGDSPDFKKGESYDVSDPNYALDADGNRKTETLKDKTTIKFKSRLPIEEEQEGEL